MSDWCPTHTRYSAKRPPNSLCGKCWELYFYHCPEDRDRYTRAAQVKLEEMQKERKERV
jgi:hypothetical protein